MLAFEFIFMFYSLSAIPKKHLRSIEPSPPQAARNALAIAVHSTISSIILLFVFADTAFSIVRMA